MNAAASSANVTGYKVTKVIGRVVNRHEIVMSPAIGGGVTLAVWLGPNRLDGWVRGYTNVDTAIAEARRIRNLIERYGTIAAVDRTFETASTELATGRPDRARASYLNRVADETENLDVRAASAQLVADVTGFLAAS